MNGMFKLAGFLSLVAGILVLAGNFSASLGEYKLVLIGGIVAVLAGLMSLLKKY
jgi:hypothetical protein